MQLVNARTGAVVASVVEVARTRAERRRGLLGRTSLADESALVLEPCYAIHTFAMRFSIDVAFMDKQGNVRKTVHRLRPWRVAVAPGAATTIEFAAGQLDAHAVRVGDELRVVPAPSGA